MSTNDKELFFEDLMFDTERSEPKPIRRRSSTSSKYKKQTNVENEQRKTSKVSYSPIISPNNDRLSSSFTFRNQKFTRSFSPNFKSVGNGTPLESPKVELDEGILIDIENKNEDKLKNQKEIFEKINQISKVLSVEKISLTSSSDTSLLLTFNQNEVNFLLFIFILRI
jgi:hypothetical protein